MNALRALRPTSKTKMTRLVRGTAGEVVELADGSPCVSADASCPAQRSRRGRGSHRTITGEIRRAQRYEYERSEKQGDRHVTEGEPPPQRARPTKQIEGRAQNQRTKETAGVAKCGVDRQRCATLARCRAAGAARSQRRRVRPKSLFQVGGNIGSASGPLLAAFVVVTHGQSSIAWFSGAALIAIFVLLLVGGGTHAARPRDRARALGSPPSCPPRRHARTGCRGGRSFRRWPSSWPCSSPRTCTAPARLVLHLLSDRQVPPAGRDSAALSVRVPLRHRGRHPRRRSGILVYAQELLPGRVGLAATALLPRQPGTSL